MVIVNYVLPVWVSWVSAFTLSQVKNQAKSFQRENSYDIKQKEIKIYRWTCVVITKRADAIQKKQQPYTSLITLFSIMIWKLFQT